MRSKILILGFLVMGIFGCRVALVPPYDASIEAQVTKTARLTDALYLQMLDVQEPDRKYDRYAARYQDIQVEINALLLKTQVREHNRDLLVMVQNLQKIFVQFKEDHKTKTLLNDADIQLNQMQINASWVSLLVAEKNLQKQK